jgi:hypothetical protein
MRIDRRFLNLGAFFLVLGAVPLAVQQGLLDRDLAARAWQLWPLLIVAAGIGLVLRRTPFEPVGGLLAALTAGSMLGGLVAVGMDIGDIGRACGGGGDQAFTGQQGTIGSTGRVRLELSCGDLTVSTAAGSAWSLGGTSTDGQAPTVASAPESLSIESRERGGFFVFGASHREDWTVTLPTEPTLDLEVDVNAGSAVLGLAGAKVERARFTANAGSLRIDFTGSTLSRLDVDVNAASARIILPSASISGRFEANAGSVAFCVPEGVVIRVTTSDNITGSNNFAARGLTKSGSTWETPGFSAASNRIDLTASANAASITLNPEDGCR